MILILFIFSSFVFSELFSYYDVLEEIYPEDMIYAESDEEIFEEEMNEEFHEEIFEEGIPPMEDSIMNEQEVALARTDFKASFWTSNANVKYLYLTQNVDEGKHYFDVICLP
ncbi:hypothetical protein KO317_02455 [Candidatus Micrarchaeota archaeon]|jgi:hypothetical protein|nr:hypothetical protein [Candidatus Micrarchaeota archaeon]